MRTDLETVADMVDAWFDQHGVWHGTAGTFAAWVWPKDPAVAAARVAALDDAGVLLVGADWICRRQGGEQFRRSAAAVASDPPAVVFPRVFA